MKFLFFLLLLGLNLGLSTVFAQPLIRPLAAPASAFQPANVYYLSIDNPGGQSLRMYLKTELKDRNENLLWQSKSEVFLLGPEGRNFEAGGLAEAESSYAQEESALKTGLYQLCYRLYTEDFGEEMARICVARRVVELSLDQMGLPQLEKKISFSGQARISGQYADFPQLYAGASAKYARLEATPSIGLFGIPLQGRVFLSTEDPQLRYDVNSINLSFDVQKFQAMLLQRLKGKLQEEGGDLLKKRLYRMRDSLYQKAKEKLGPKVAILEKGDMAKQIAELKDLERLDEILQMPAYQEFQKKWEPYAQLSETELDALEDSLKQTNPAAYQRLQKLFSQYESFDRILERKEKLEHQAEKLKKVLALKSQLEELESLKKASLEELAKDPRIYQKLGLLKKGENLLGSLQKMGLGSVFPYYSPLSVNGVSLRGADIEFQKGNIFMAISAGQVQQTAFLFDTLKAQTPVNTSFLTAFRMGLGKKDANHLHVLAVHSRNDSLTSFLHTPANRLWGLEGKLDFFKQKGSIEGEFLQSLTHQEAPNFFQQNLSSWDSLRNANGGVEGRAMRFRMQYELSKYTRLSGLYEKVDPGFYSAGTPFMLRDRMRYELQLKQQLWKRRLEVGAFMKRDRNALAFFPQNQLKTRSLGVSLNLRIAKLPYLMLSYAPFRQENKAENEVLAQRNTGLFHLNSGYNYQAAGIAMSTQVSILRQEGSSTDSLGQFYIEQIQLSQNFSLGSHSLSLRAILGKQLLAETLAPLSGFSGSFSSQLAEKLSLSGGANYFSNPSTQIQAQSNVFLQANMR
ncbi:MAG: hypothetical protein AAF696_23150, partial [Bacteroidota bacterium]